MPEKPAGEAESKQSARSRPGISRRELLRRAGLAGAVVVVPGAPTPSTARVERSQEPLETLTAVESDTLEAIVARLIPTDANGPGAAEARAAHYIDRALTGPLASSRAMYSAGLEAVDRYAETVGGARFRELRAEDQDTVLSDMEANRATGFSPDSSTFLELLRAHTIQGTFSDPYYGGNANFVGWDLIGYPGVRTLVTPEEQLLDTKVEPNHRSAYDYPMFTKGGV